MGWIKDKMNIKESLNHYIGVYCGSEKRIIKNSVFDNMYNFKKLSDVKRTVEENILWLIENKCIKVVG